MVTSPETLATVGDTVITTADVRRRVQRIRAEAGPDAFPVEGSGEDRRLRRWVVHSLVDEAVIGAEAARLGLIGHAADEPAGAAVLAVFEAVTAGVTVDEDAIGRYYARNTDRYRRPQIGSTGRTATVTVPLEAARDAITDDLLAAERGRCFDAWLGERRAALATVAAGHEHPGDPRAAGSRHRH